MNMHDPLRPGGGIAAYRALALSIVMTLAACSGSDRPDRESANPVTPEVPGSAAQVRTKVGGITVSAVALQTSQIPSAVSEEHGIERRDDLIMLRISPRIGAIGNLRSAPAQVRATVTDMRGAVSAIALDEQMTAGLIDHVGTFEATLPATLRFDITVATPQGDTKTLEMTREFR